MLRRLLGLTITDFRDLKPQTLVIYRGKLGKFGELKKKVYLPGEHQSIRVNYLNPQTLTVHPSFRITSHQTVHWEVPNPPRYPNLLDHLLLRYWRK